MRPDRKYSSEAFTTFAGFANTECFRKSHSEIANVFKASKGFGYPIFDSFNVNLMFSYP